MSSRKVRIVFATLVVVVAVMIGAVTLFGVQIRSLFGGTTAALAGDRIPSHAYDAHTRTYYSHTKRLSNFGSPPSVPVPAPGQPGP